MSNQALPWSEWIKSNDTYQRSVYCGTAYVMSEVSPPPEPKLSEPFGNTLVAVNYDARPIIETVLKYFEARRSPWDSL